MRRALVVMGIAVSMACGDGVNWTDADVNGAGSNSGLTFDVAQLPVLSVTP